MLTGKERDKLKDCIERKILQRAGELAYLLREIRELGFDDYSFESQPNLNGPWVKGSTNPERKHS